MKRRAFLTVLAGSVGLMAARVAMLPRPLSEAEIAALEQAPLAPTASPTGEPLGELAADFTPPRPAMFQDLDLGPRLTSWRSTFKINTAERDPQKGLDRWRLEIGGLVERPLTLTLETLSSALPMASQVKDFHCVEGWGVKDVRWEGIPFQTVLEAVQPLPAARAVTFHTMGNAYSDSLTLEQALQPGVMLATHLNGEPLPDRQGYPCRLVMPEMYGYKSVKWLSRIEFVDYRHVGFWERRGWPIDPWVIG